MSTFYQQNNKDLALQSSKQGEISQEEILSLRLLATKMRQDIIRMQQRGTGVGSALSIVDLLVVLYCKIMHIPTPADPNRDRFLLSKGHAASALYAVLRQKGFLAEEDLTNFLADTSVLTGHPSHQNVAGVEFSSGSLGHGLAMGVGFAWAAQLDKHTWRTFVLLGDGELQEGSVWEAANQAARLRLENLTVIIDANGLQGYDRVENQMPFASLRDKWEAFGWQCVEIDGHNYEAIAASLAIVTAGRPRAVIARTIKGKGVLEMEDQLGWHYFNVPREKLDHFLGQLSVEDAALSGASRQGGEDA